MRRTIRRTSVVRRGFCVPVLDKEFVEKITPFSNYHVIQITNEWDGETVESYTIWKMVDGEWTGYGGDFNGRFIVTQEPDHVHLEQSYRAFTCSHLCLEALEPKLPPEMIHHILQMTRINKRVFLFKKL